jgi:hypothetical protein
MTRPVDGLLVSHRSKNIDSMDCRNSLLPHQTTGLRTTRLRENNSKQRKEKRTGDDFSPPVSITEAFDPAEFTASASVVRNLPVVIVDDSAE